MCDSACVCVVWYVCWCGGLCLGACVWWCMCTLSGVHSPGLAELMKVSIG